MKAAVLLFLAFMGMVHQILAQLKCDIPNDKVNASDSVTLIDPYRTPNGLFQNGSGQWTWTVATQSSSGTSNGSPTIGQVLRLNVDPVPNLLAANSSYIGCGVIVHGLSHQKRVNGQSDTGGRCDGSLSAACRDGLVSLVEQHARTAPFDAGIYKQPQDICRNLRDLGDGNIIKSCEGDFDEGTWFEPFRK
jgi:hypothetical protein